MNSKETEKYREHLITLTTTIAHQAGRVDIDGVHYSVLISGHLNNKRSHWSRLERKINDVGDREHMLRLARTAIDEAYAEEELEEEYQQAKIMRMFLYFREKLQSAGIHSREETNALAANLTSTAVNSSAAASATDVLRLIGDALSS